MTDDVALVAEVLRAYRAEGHYFYFCEHGKFRAPCPDCLAAAVLAALRSHGRLREDGVREAREAVAAVETDFHSMPWKNALLRAFDAIDALLEEKE